MSLSAAFNIISSSFAANAAQTAVVSNNIANANTPGYSREIANSSPIPTAAPSRLGDPRRQRGAGGAGHDIDRAGGRAAGDRRRPCDAGADGQRQLVVLLDVGRDAERRFALGDARQSAERARRPTRLAKSSHRRRTPSSPRRKTLADSLNSGSAAVADGARAGRSGHGLVGRDDQFAAQPVHRRQQRGRERACRPAPTSRAPRITRDSIVTPAFAADRRLDRSPPPTARCRSIPTAA